MGDLILAIKSEKFLIFIVINLFLVLFPKLYFNFYQLKELIFGASIY
jgi:hypothetical protein